MSVHVNAAFKVNLGVHILKHLRGRANVSVASDALAFAATLVNKKKFLSMLLKINKFAFYIYLNSTKIKLTFYVIVHCCILLLTSIKEDCMTLLKLLVASRYWLNLVSFCPSKFFLI